MPVATHSLANGVEVVTMDWFAGRAPPTRPVLAVCYRNGLLQLMRNCIDEGR